MHKKSLVPDPQMAGFPVFLCHIILNGILLDFALLVEQRHLKMSLQGFLHYFLTLHIF